MKHLLILAFVLFASSLAFEQEKEPATGNNLLPGCKASIDAVEGRVVESGKVFDAAFCLGLVKGVASASSSVCPPKGSDAVQGIRVVVKFMEDHPEKLNIAEEKLVNMALTQAFPCHH